MSTANLLVHLVLLVATTTLIPLSSACNPLDKAALLAFKNSFPSNAFSDWNTSEDCCSWNFRQIRCSKRTGRVRFLVIRNNPNVSGTIPPAIGGLTELKILKFDTLPNLVGPFPPQFAKLKKLRYFNVYTTGLSGHIPSYFSKFTQLFELTLSGCKFKGPIPPSFVDLTKLTFLSLTGNKLTGTIPPLYSKFQFTINYPNLDLSSNKLTGPVPPSFATVPFNVLYLQNNQLCGELPTFTAIRDGASVSFDNNKCLCGKPLPPCK